MILTCLTWQVYPHLPSLRVFSERVHPCFQHKNQPGFHITTQTINTLLYFRVQIHRSFNAPILTMPRNVSSKAKLHSLVNNDKTKDLYSVSCRNCYWNVSKSGHNKHSTVCICQRVILDKKGREKYKKQSNYQAHSPRALYQESKKRGGRRVSGCFLLKPQLHSHESSTNELDLGSELSTWPIPL